MATIQVTLLNTPIIRLEGQQITFPLKKADALFFYMAVQKNVTRTELSNLLWGGQSETASRKNLRNALYVIKKAFGFDPFESPKQQILKLNHEVTFQVDYDSFLETRDIQLYAEDFLHGFALKDSYEFDEWMNAVRSRTLDIYLHQVFREFQQTPSSQITIRENLFHRYIQSDPLDERIYMSMMETYMEEKLYLKGIKCYENLVQTLKNELNMTPSPEISQLFRVMMQRWKESKDTNAGASDHVRHALLSGRKRELQLLWQAYSQLQLHHGSTIFVLGEHGVGKSYLCQYFLDELSSENCLIMNAFCFEQKNSAALYVWSSLLLQLQKQCKAHNIELPAQFLETLRIIFPMLDTFNSIEELPMDVTASYNYRAVRNSVLRLLSQISEQIPLVIFIDNLQHMDDMSTEWLSSLIRSDNDNILILGTCSLHPRTETDRFINTMVTRRNVSKLTLNRFTEEDIRSYVASRHLEHLVSDNDITHIFHECKGNPFYLTLLLDHLQDSDPSDTSHPRAIDILAQRFTSLDHEEQRLLELISLFPDYTTLELLTWITGQDSMHILNLTDHLEQKEMIEEATENNKIRFSFIHPQMQDFVQHQISPSKARLYHSRSANYLEKLPKRTNPLIYHHLIEHFTLAGNQPKALFYKIRRMETYANLNYELYPVLNASVSSIAPSHEEIFNRLTALEEELAQCYSQEPEAIDYSEAEARLCLTMGKTYIQQGMYDKGVPYIRHALKNNRFTAEHPKIRQSFHRQLVYYGIQTWQLDLIEESVEECFRIDVLLQDSCQRAINLRLKGLLYLLQGDMDRARELLTQAVETFQSTPLALQIYSINLAACYQYLSRVEWLLGHVQEALAYINKAIQLCEDKKVPINPTFYVSLASCYMAIGREEEAVRVARTARCLYENSPELMGLSDCFLLSSLLAFRQGDLESAAEMMHRCHETAFRLQYPPTIYGYFLFCDYYRSLHKRDFSHMLPTVTKEERALLKPLPDIWKNCWKPVFH